MGSAGVRGLFGQKMAVGELLGEAGQKGRMVGTRNDCPNLIAVIFCGADSVSFTGSRRASAVSVGGRWYSGNLQGEEGKMGQMG